MDVRANVEAVVTSDVKKTKKLISISEEFGKRM